MHKHVLAAALGAALLGGCQGRQLIHVEDGPSGGNRTTVVETLDTAYYVVFGTAKLVYWECGQEGDGLTCKKTCDVKDDQGDKVLCQRLPFVMK